LNDLALFTDASINPKLRRGMGASLLVSASYLEMPAEDIDCADIISRLKIHHFEDTSSTKIEVQTVLWALEDYKINVMPSAKGKLSIYCDSECVSNLLQRRTKLESRRFLSGKTSCELKNSLLYRQFYKLYDEIGFEVIKVKGHSPSSSHNSINRIFSFVDKQVRKSLKQWLRG
jgi:hypothetical protein